MGTRGILGGINGLKTILTNNIKRLWWVHICNYLNKSPRWIWVLAHLELNPPWRAVLEYWSIGVLETSNHKSHSLRFQCSPLQLRFRRDLRQVSGFTLYFSFSCNLKPETRHPTPCDKAARWKSSHPATFETLIVLLSLPPWSPVFFSDHSQSCISTGKPWISINRD